MPLLGIYPTKMKTYTNKNLYKNIPKNIIQNSQEVETTQVLVNWWTDK